MGAASSRQHTHNGSLCDSREFSWESPWRKIASSAPLDVFSRRHKHCKRRKSQLGGNPTSFEKYPSALSVSSEQVDFEDDDDDQPGTPKFLSEWQEQLASSGSDPSSPDMSPVWQRSYLCGRQQFNADVVHALEKLVLENCVDGDLPPELYFGIGEAQEESNHWNSGFVQRLSKSCPLIQIQRANMKAGLCQIPVDSQWER